VPLIQWATPRESEMGVLKNLSMNSYREVSSHNSKNRKKKPSVFLRERSSMQSSRVA